MNADPMGALLRLRAARERVRAAIRELRNAQLDELLAERDYLDAKEFAAMQQGGPVAKVPTMVPKADLMGPEVTDRSTDLPCCTDTRRH
jgi:hypothetical protein